MRVLVDTNILLRRAQPSHPLCPQATHAVSKLLRQNDAVCFCSQNIAEFWNVATQEEFVEKLKGIGSVKPMTNEQVKKKAKANGFKGDAK